MKNHDMNGKWSNFVRLSYKAGVCPEAIRTGACFLYDLLDLYRKVTICSRVQGILGLKVSAEVSPVIRAAAVLLAAGTPSGFLTRGLIFSTRAV